MLPAPLFCRRSNKSVILAFQRANATSPPHAIRLGDLAIEYNEEVKSLVCMGVLAPEGRELWYLDTTKLAMIERRNIILTLAVFVAVVALMIIAFAIWGFSRV